MPAGSPSRSCEEDTMTNERHSEAPPGLTTPIFLKRRENSLLSEEDPVFYLVTSNDIFICGSRKGFVMPLGSL